MNILLVESENLPTLRTHVTFVKILSVDDGNIVGIKKIEGGSTTTTEKLILFIISEKPSKIAFDDSNFSSLVKSSLIEESTKYGFDVSENGEITFN